MSGTEPPNCLPKETKIHSGGFYVSTNEESEFPYYDLADSVHWRNNFSVRNFKSNGLYVGTVHNASLRKEIDKLHDNASRVFDQHRNLVTTVFNTMKLDDPRRNELLDEKYLPAPIDRGRNMLIVSKLLKKEVEFQNSCTDIATSVRDLILSDLKNTNKHKMVLTLLETEAPTMNVKSQLPEEIADQMMHTDVNSKDPRLDKDHMFIGLLATQQGPTQIRVVLKSHVRHFGLAKRVHLVTLGRYDYFVAHPKLIHGGCGCRERNVRLHFYHGLPKQASDQTFYVDWGLFQSNEQLASARERGNLLKRKLKRLCLKK
jgi:hypothetical protein